jgi:hypothetical protein
MAIEGEIALTVSPAIIGETLDVLGRKFGVKSEELPEYREVIELAARTLHPTVDSTSSNTILRTTGYWIAPRVLARSSS